MTTALDPPPDVQRPARPTRTLIGVVIALTLLNTTATALWPSAGDSYFALFAWAMYGFEPIAFGIWAALGTGSILKRLIIAVPCLVFVFVCPGFVPAAFANLRQNEYTAGLVMGLGIFAASTVIFLIVRMFTGLGIVSTTAQTSRESAGLRFSIKELLGIVTLYAVVLGLLNQLAFRAETDSNNLIFGPDFFIRFLLFGSSIVFAAVLPTFAIPLAVMYGRPSRRATTYLLVVWAMITLSATFIFRFVEGDSFLEILGPLIAIQMSAATAGALTASWLRHNGLRLVRPPRLATQQATPTS